MSNERTDSDELQMTTGKLPLELVTLGCLLLLEVARRVGNGLAGVVVHLGHDVISSCGGRHLDDNGMSPDGGRKVCWTRSWSH